MKSFPTCIDAYVYLQYNTLVTTLILIIIYHAQHVDPGCSMNHDIFESFFVLQEQSQLEIVAAPVNMVEGRFRRQNHVNVAFLDIVTDQGFGGGR